MNLKRGFREIAKAISLIAVVIGSITLLAGLFCFLAGVYLAFSPFGDFDFIGLFLALVTVPLYCLLFWPLAASGLVLSTVALFAAPNKRLALAGLLSVLVGVCLFLASYAL